MTDEERRQLCAAIWTALEPEKPIVDMEWPCIESRTDGTYAALCDRSGNLKVGDKLYSGNALVAWPAYRTSIIHWEAIPNYTDWPALPGLLDAMRERGWVFDIHTCCNAEPIVEVECWTIVPEPRGTKTISADTLPLAVALAARAALTGEPS